MIVDSSVFVAIIRDEDEAAEFSRILGATPALSISAPTLLEASIVLGRDHQVALDALVAAAGATVAPFDEEQARIARTAYARFGKGSGSRARLNLGDCFSYALATVTGQPLLFKGDDFTHTDVTAAFTGAR